MPASGGLTRPDKVGPTGRTALESVFGLRMAKPHKVEEPAGTYAAAPRPSEKTPAVQTGVRFADAKTVQKTNAKLMQVHRKVLQKLAQ